MPGVRSAGRWSLKIIWTIRAWSNDERVGAFAEDLIGLLAAVTGG
jgi:hypothetical protein